MFFLVYNLFFKTQHPPYISQSGRQEMLVRQKMANTRSQRSMVDRCHAGTLCGFESIGAPGVPTISQSAEFQLRS